jgi:inosine-uridine nucleoside N-ribohydrolase
LALQVTHTVLATADVASQVESMQSAFGAQLTKLLQFFKETYRDTFFFKHPPVHDPVAVVYLLAPEIFESELMRIDVETHSELSAGQTVCDVWHKSSKRKNVNLCKRVDVDKCWSIIIEAMQRCDKKSPLNKSFL